MDDPERIRNLTVIQEFNNKKATAHATIFVASMFALFTVLSLAQRIVFKISTPNVSLNSLNWNYTILGLSVASYILIWIFGLYELLNFSYYSTVAQRTEEKLVQGMDRELVTEYQSTWKGISKRFASFKVPDKPQNWVRRNNENIAAFVYFAIGGLPLTAFLIWFFLG